MTLIASTQTSLTSAKSARWLTRIPPHERTVR